ncbi:MAG TPA: tRNA pseudouridine(55) synthase TruB [Actinomycetota bacterium]|nr:tRNA pseudouridine(55) synthase TruB [Actinomycetota bacterium]
MPGVAPAGPQPDGVLVVDKPPGVTSHDVVDAVRRKLGTRKVGHGGTLDPDATGILLVGAGRATRFLSYAQAAPKRYVAGARFGAETTTQDASGEVVATSDPDFTEAELQAALAALTGDIEQVPPMVSAVKVGGERLYAKARRGEEVERAARRVTVYELELLKYDGGAHQATLEVLCSGGTYVRTLIHDLGRALGCGAHMTALRRTAAAGFTELDALPLDAVDASALRPLGDAVRELPRLDVDAEAARAVAHGRPLDARPPGGPHVAVFHDGELIAVYRATEEGLRPDRVVPGGSSRGPARDEP